MKIWEFTDDYCIRLITISFNYSKKRQKIDSMFKVQIFEEGHKIRNSPSKLVKSTGTFRQNFLPS